MATANRRRWLQLSVRMLLSLMLIAAGFGLGWSAYRWQHQQELDELHTLLEKWDGVESIPELGIYLDLPGREETGEGDQPNKKDQEESEARREFFNQLRQRAPSGGFGPPDGKTTQGDGK